MFWKLPVHAPVAQPGRCSSSLKHCLGNPDKQARVTSSNLVRGSISSWRVPRTPSFCHAFGRAFSTRTRPETDYASLEGKERSPSSAVSYTGRTLFAGQIAAGLAFVQS